MWHGGIPQHVTDLVVGVSDHWYTVDFSPFVGAQQVLLMLSYRNISSTGVNSDVSVRTPGDEETANQGLLANMVLGVQSSTHKGAYYQTHFCVTDSNGHIEFNVRNRTNTYRIFYNGHDDAWVERNDPVADLLFSGSVPTAYTDIPNLASIVGERTLVSLAYKHLDPYPFDTAGMAVRTKDCADNTYPSTLDSDEHSSAFNYTVCTSPTYIPNRLTHQMVMTNDVGQAEHYRFTGTRNVELYLKGYLPGFINAGNDVVLGPVAGSSWTWTTLDLSAYLPAGPNLVMLGYRRTSGGTTGLQGLSLRTNGDPNNYDTGRLGDNGIQHARQRYVDGTYIDYVFVGTDSNNVIEWRTDNNYNFQLELVAYTPSIAFKNVSSAKLVSPHCIMLSFDAYMRVNSDLTDISNYVVRDASFNKTCTLLDVYTPTVQSQSYTGPDPSGGIPDCVYITTQEEVYSHLGVGAVVEVNGAPVDWENGMPLGTRDAVISNVVPSFAPDYGVT